MPNRDGSGPQGGGSKTGRGLGPCNPGGGGAVPQPGRGTGRAGQFGTNRGSGLGGQRKGGGRGSGRRR
ncbi:MAG: DUF5320 domain-containing protein [Deltaproteobacteria bacterium]|nr:DUF5320 domain-containing protein [Deltaproteobacteria bacterium]